MLDTDSFLVSAIKADSRLNDAIDGNIFPTAVPVPDEDLDNVPLPYVIVTYDGMTQDTDTKDQSGYESDSDINTCRVEVVAESRESLAELISDARRAIRKFFEEGDGDGLSVEDYTVSAGRVDYDPLKPCYYQDLTYQITTPND